MISRQNCGQFIFPLLTIGMWHSLNADSNLNLLSRLPAYNWTKAAETLQWTENVRDNVIIIWSVCATGLHRFFSMEYTNAADGCVNTYNLTIIKLADEYG